MTKIKIKRIRAKASQNLKDPKKIFKKSSKKPKTKLKKKEKKSAQSKAPITKQETTPQKTIRGKIGCGSVILVILLSLIVGSLAGAFGSGTAKYWIARYVFQDENAEEVIEETKHVSVEEDSAIIETAQKASPAVVSIIATSKVQDFLGQSYSEESGGTGFIITSDGMIMTNRHVVSNKKGSYKVLTHDGKSYEASVVDLDPVNDIAVIQIEADNLPVVSFGDSDKLQVGQRVVAIGNALGEYDNTVTAGVVSAIGRTISAYDGGSYEKLEGVIQTDAAINEGNSGGPLVNLEGQIVGINTAIDKGGQLISFAIPSNVVKEAMDSVLEHGRIIRPLLGVRYLEVTKELAELNDLSSEKGALVYSGSSSLLAVIPDSPADKAGLEVNDIITKVNDDEINQENSLSRLLQRHSPGSEIELTIIRDGKEIKVKAKLEEAK
ncbi:S1C family serine protease [Patescibacteria group bacterium]